MALPRLTPLTSSTMDVLKFGLLSNAVDAYTLRDIADWTVSQQLLALPGIARVTVYGGAIRQVQIQPDLDRLAGLGLTVNDVMEAGRSALAIRGGGTIDTSSQRITLDAPPPTPDPQAIAQALVVMQDNTPITIGHVATVTIGPAVPIGDATIMGKPGVLVTVSSQYGANTLEATEAVEAALDELKPALKQRGIDIILLHRPASFIERALGNLEHALALGSALILAVLYAFLRSWKAALISFLAIPMSLLAAVFVLAEFGQTINTMTLGGFALALGVLVDDAIIDIENIMRRLRLARAAGTRRRHHDDRGRLDRDPRVDALRDAGRHLRLPADPVCRRHAGEVHRADGARLHRRRAGVDAGGAHGDASALRADAHRRGDRGDAAPPRADEAYACLVHGDGSDALALDGRVACRGGGGGARRRAFPAQRAHSAVSRRALRDPNDHGGAGDVGRGRGRDGVRLSNELLKLPFVRAVGHQIGRAEVGEDTWSPDKSEFHVELTGEHQETETEAQEKIREVLEDFPEVRTEAMTFLGDRISESLSGETAQMVVNLTGTDLETLEHSAEAVETAIATTRGVQDLRIPRAAKVPTMQLEAGSGRARQLRAHGAGGSRHRSDGVCRDDDRADLRRRADRRCRGHPAARQAQPHRATLEPARRQCKDARAAGQRGVNHDDRRPLQHPARGGATPGDRQLQRLGGPLPERHGGGGEGAHR